MDKERQKSSAGDAGLVAESEDLLSGVSLQLRVSLSSSGFTTGLLLLIIVNH